MNISIELEKAKNFLSCSTCNKYTLTANVDGVIFKQAYYGYPKRMALSEFKKYVKTQKRDISRQDVLNVASSINKTLTDSQIDLILQEYNPTNGDLWLEEVENIIYQIQ